MKNKEQKRKHDRIDSLHLLNYICFDENNEEVNQGMGRTLNVSQGGILLETHIPVNKNHIISLSIGIEEDLVDIQGKVIYNRQGESGKTETGIEFVNIDDASLHVLKRYIIAFRELQEQKDE